MHLAYLEIRNLRCVAHCALHPSAQLNVIFGPNASGKTTLLESIYFLAHARSFRTRQVGPLIRAGQQDLGLLAQLRGSEGRVIPMGVARGESGLEIRVAGRTLRQASELAAHLPLLLLNKDSHYLLERGAEHRRRLLDWGVFHTDRTFIAAWQAYRRALKQRNEALRLGQSRASVSVWDKEMSRAAAQIHAHRDAYLVRLRPLLQARAETLLHRNGFALEYFPGWVVDADLADVLGRSLEHDRVLGYTQHGPHRADLSLTAGGAPVPHRLSAGEQKLLLCALRIAQLALLTEAGGEPGVVLVDDLPAELDADNRKRLLDDLLRLESQVFVTATDLDLLNIDNRFVHKLFHVEQGKVNEYPT